MLKAEGLSGTTPISVSCLFWLSAAICLTAAATQYCDGARGVIVVKDPQDPYLSLYDADNGNEDLLSLVRPLSDLQMERS